MKRYIGVAQKIIFSEDKPEIQLFRVGVFHDDRYGKIKITSENLKQAKKNFDEKIRGVDVALDFSHENHKHAAGWIESLELRNNDTELWGIVQYTEPGKKAVSDKQYRYISPEFNEDYVDNESLKKYGFTLLGAALTNRPVIKKMEPAIALSELSEKEIQNMNELEKAKKDLEDTQKKLSDAEAALQKEKDAKAAPVVPAKKADDAGGAMSPEDAMKMISELKAKIVELEGQLKAKDEQVVMAEKEKAFNKMLDEGKVCPAQKQAYLDGDIKKFSELFEPANLKAKGADASGKEESTDKTPEDELFDKATKLSEEKKISFTEAARQVLSEDEVLANKMK